MRKHIVMTSGGVGSFMALEMVVKKFGAENVISLFADTKMEDEDLYRFLDDIHDFLGIDMTLICDGRTPWEVFRDVKFIGNSRVDPCSRILKREFMDKWIEERFKPEECICYVGIDWTEKHRIDRLAERKKPYVYKAPLVDELVMVSNDKKMKFCTDRGILPPRLYRLGFSHNNCGGYCVKAGLGQFKMLFEKLPERYLEHEAMEQQLMSENETLRPFLRKVEDGETRYLTMKEYREEYLEGPRQLDLMDEFDLGGCGCAL